MTPSVLVAAGGLNVGGGRTYAVALADELERGGPRGLRWEFLVQPELGEVLAKRSPSHIRLRAHRMASPVARMAWEQLVAPFDPAIASADVLVSAANFGPLARRHGHVLLAHNALHFTDGRIRGRQGFRMRCESALAWASVRRASVTVTATETMASLVSARTGRNPIPIPFGPGLVRRRATRPRRRFTFVHRTTWGPHKRFGYLLLAVRELASTNPGSFVVRSACDPASPFARKHLESRRERELLEAPDIAEHVEVASYGLEGQAELDGDAVVMPSTTESFCFPLAEGLALGLPIVAADSSFARELCGQSAVLAEPESPRALAAGMRRIIDGEVPPRLDVESRGISWRRHVDGLAEICHRCAANRGARATG